MATRITFASGLFTALLLCQTSRAQVDSSNANRYVSSFDQREGTHLVLIYIGSQDCGPCHSAELKASVEQAKQLLQKRAQSEGKVFSAIGVIKNYDWKEGLSFLEETGYFDEVVAGRSWFNSAVVEHCFTREECDPAMPQIIVYEQVVTTAEGRLVFGSPEYLATVTGGDRIPEWVNNGLPLADERE